MISRFSHFQEAILPASWAPLLDVLRGEIWVVPVLVASGLLASILILFEIYLLIHTLRSRHASSRRHLFLGQVMKTSCLFLAAFVARVALEPEPFEFLMNE